MPDHGTRWRVTSTPVRVRKLDQPRGWTFTLGAVILKPLFFLTTKRDWIGGLKIPATGGCVLVINHLSHVDPLTAAVFTHDHGRLPRYLAKAGLFRNRFLGAFMRAAGQIPVERASASAAGAFAAAVEAVRAGECIVIYPEGTITRDPDLWPMTGKSGAARIALETGCPVIPIGQWGAQELLAPYAKKPDLFPRKTDPHPRRRPGRPRRPRRPPPRRGGAPRGHRADHGRHHRPRRGAARRAGPRREVRHAGGGPREWSRPGHAGPGRRTRRRTIGA